MYIVTGGGRGIGRALALELASRGKTVLIVGRHETALKEVASLCSGIHYQVADVSSPQSRKALVQAIGDTPISALVHNAGIIDPITPLANMPLEAWQSLMATNVEAPLFLSQALLKNLKGGRVLHMGSGAAYIAIASWSAYCTSKAALSMLTRCWQAEFSDPAFGSVMPGIIDTDMMTTIRHSQSMNPEKREFFQNLKRSNRLLKTETVALFLSWLLLEVKETEYASKEWDIYDTSHHSAWLPDTHCVPSLE